MATRVEEAYGERDQKVDARGAVTEIEIPYLVFGGIAAPETGKSVRLREFQIPEAFLSGRNISRLHLKQGEIPVCSMLSKSENTICGEWPWTSRLHYDILRTVPAKRKFGENPTQYELL